LRGASGAVLGYLAGIVGDVDWGDFPVGLFLPGSGEDSFDILPPLDVGDVAIASDDFVL